MRRQRVKSSVIATVGYDPVGQVLEVEFHSGRVYRYHLVPPREHEALMKADSVGGYFNKRIREKYEGWEVDASKAGRRVG